MHKNKSRKPAYCNTELLDYIVRELEVVQEPFFSKPLQEEESEGLNGPVLLREKLKTEKVPTYFGEQLLQGGVPFTLINDLYIFKVNTRDSIFHSILGLLDSNYQVASWEEKQLLVSRFKNKICYDVHKNGKLKHWKITKKEFNQCLHEHIPSEMLKKFICLYLDVNLIIVTSREFVEFFPTDNLDISKPFLLLFQYPFGNLAPIIQTDVENQTLVWGKSKILEAVLPLQQSQQSQQSHQIQQTKKPHTKQTQQTHEIHQTKIEKPIKKTLLSLKKVKVAKKDPERDIVKELMKLSLHELQSLCEKYSIETKKPASKTGTYKNKTKKELTDLLKDCYKIDN